MPRTPALDTQLRARIDAFADELADLVKQAALESVREALGDGKVPVRRRGPGRPRGARKKAARRPGRPAGRRRFGRRFASASPAAVLAQIKKGDGIGVGEIAAVLGTSSDAVKPAIAELLAGKQIRKTGVRRGTKYYPGAARKARPKKAGKKRRAIKKKGTRRPGTKQPEAAAT